MANSIRPVPLPDLRDLPLSYQRWFDSVRKIVEQVIVGTIPWAQVDKAGANITDIPDRAHDNLTAFDGGSSGEYFHFTSSQHSSFTVLDSYTSNQSLSASNGYVLADATSGNLTMTLPAASARKRLHIKKIDSSANTVTVQRAGSDTIEGSNTHILTNQYDSVTLYSNGTATWYIEGQT